MKHSDIRQAILNALEMAIDNDVIYFDGRPAVFEENDFPAVAVYLTDAEPTGGLVDADEWRAILHIEVFLPAQVPDSELDEWMETHIYPVMSDIQALTPLVSLINTEGYEYQRDEDLALWSSADLKYSIIYEM